MTKPFALCSGSGLDYCQSCQRLRENQPEASREPNQAWIMPTDSNHCAYYLQTHRADLDRGRKP